MSEIQPYFPQPIFAGDDGNVPRVIIAPHRYIQGAGVLDNLGRYISLLPSSRPLVLISKGGQKRFGEQILASLTTSGVTPIFRIFEGECSYEGVARLIDSLKNEDNKVDALIAVGGGKCLDTGKAVAFRLAVPVVICPTIASTDAPCSAVAVMYTEEGVGMGPEFYPNSPALVIVDSSIIAASPLRHLVAGMGDALATYYEARTCYNNSAARSMVGGRVTITALAIAKLSASTLFEHGLAAIEAIKNKTINEPVEQIIEANTLLSGVGFESAGLSAAHAVAAGLTAIPLLHKEFLHGELVGMGLLTMLILEENSAEAEKVAGFLVSVGLPANLEQLSLDLQNDEEAIKNAIAASLESGLTASEPFEVTPEKLYNAFIEAHYLGLKISKTAGDKAYRLLHP